jgi:hypothetical protein
MFFLQEYKALSLYGDPTAPGVLAILTHHNMPRMNPLPWSHLRPQGQTYLPVQDDKAIELPQRVWPLSSMVGDADNAIVVGLARACGQPPTETHPSQPANVTKTLEATLYSGPSST